MGKSLVDAFPYVTALYVCTNFVVSVFDENTRRAMFEGIPIIIDLTVIASSKMTRVS